MGADIVYFVDHDLPIESASLFLKEFNKRIKGDIHWNVYADTDICSFDNYFPNTQGDVCITFYNENEKKINIDLSLAGRTLQIFEHPCTILQNADAFGHSSNINQPIYILDL